MRAAAHVAFHAAIAAAVGPIAEYNPLDPPPPEEIAATDAVDWPDGFRGVDCRLKLFDNVTRTWRLLDTGAMVSVCPPSATDKLDKSFVLEAVDGSRIPTYGSKQIQVRLGRKTFKVKFIIADVKESILGWDFISQNKLNWIWDQWGNLFLQDSVSGIKTRLKFVSLPHGTLPGAKGLEVPSSGQPPVSANSPEARAFYLACIKSLEQEGKQSEIKPKYAKLINKYSEILTPTFQDSSTRHKVFHKIKIIEGSVPSKAKVRKLLPGSPKEVKGKAAWMELVKLGVVERVKADADTTWTSALHLQPKPDGQELRPCSDFRDLNSKSVPESYPLPCISTFTHKLRGAKIFSKVDLKKAFYNVAIQPETGPLTTTVTLWGTFVYKRLAMGLASAPGTFQRVLDTILQEVDNIYVYLDDIMVYNDNEEEHMETLEKLFTKLSENGLAIALDKCSFGQPSIEYLGYKVDETGISPLKRKVDCILKLPDPTTQKELLRFLGAVNYFRSCLKGIIKNGKFINTAEVLKPLYAAATTTDLKPKQKFKEAWDSQSSLRQSYLDAKSLIVNPVLLAHPDPNLPLALSTDASHHSVGAVLEQRNHDGVWEPLEFWSRGLGQDKLSWSTYRKELMAAQHGVRHFLEDINGRHFTIFSDHRPLIESFKSNNLQENDPVAFRALQEIGMFTRDVRHIEGEKNVFADFLSRIEPAKLGDVHTSALDKLASLSADTMQLQTMDPKTLEVSQQSCKQVENILNGKFPKNTSFQRVKFGESYLLCEMSSSKPRPVVPEEMQPRLLKVFHSLGHAGQKESVRRLASHYYWNNMKSQIKKYVKQCIPCQKVKPSRLPSPHVGKFPVPDERFSHVHVDLVGPLPESRGFKYILSIVDRTTRYVHGIPLPDPTAENCARAFLSQWLAHYGCPKIVTSDNGAAFVANLWQDMAKTLNYDVNFTALYSPMTNAMVERQHQSIKNSLKAALLEMGDAHQDKWADQLPWTLLSRRVALHQDSGTSSSELVYGKSPIIPGALLQPAEEMSQNQLRDLLKNLQSKSSTPAVQTSTHLPPPSSPDAELPPGTTHVMARQHKTLGLDPSYQGPFRLLEQVSRSQVKIQIGHNRDGSIRTELRRLQDIKPADVAEGIRSKTN